MICGAFFAAALPKVSTDALQMRDIDVVHTDDNFFVKMTLDLTPYKKMESNREVILTPMIVAGADTLALPSLMVAGRARYYLWLRQNEKKYPADALYRASSAGTVEYSADVKFEPWMEYSSLIIDARSRGCCGTPQGLAEVPVTDIDLRPHDAPAIVPQFVFLVPEAELVKKRELRGSAYIDFPVNRTELYPDYRRNPQELAKIRATIDSVRLDKDVQFKAMTFKGYASPEGPYDNNVRLAKGRTETLKKYVMNLYNFPASIISTSYEPEDWEGLRRFVETSGLENREAILAIIDSDLAPDPKNWAIKSRYPEQYAFLLREVYPGLRHSDYTVEYIVRNYTDIDEIKEVLFTAPQKLSLNEMFAASSALEPGTPEYEEAFRIAVRMYPNSPEANLNAAVVEMQSGNLDAAAKYIDKVGDSAQALYARGIYAALMRDYEAARPLLQQAVDAGIMQASDALEQLDAVENFNVRNKK
ncbi:MAG: DUF3868 domain-containing protein [Muribaculaceae bacterium]|nr:DUF3868 domain-containing protein [Muribaculaceae bacterium]